MTGVLRAVPVSTVFHVTQPTSNLTVQLESMGFSDSDTQALSGTIDATFFFGTTGDFGPLSSVNVTGAAVRAAAPFNFRLGLPAPFPGVSVTASNIKADVTTPVPPVTLTKLAGPGVTYQYDASRFLINANEGTIVATGLVSDSLNLADEPVSGMSPSGTLGSVTFTAAGTSGFYTLVNAVMTLPMHITDVAELGDPTDPTEVNVDMNATVNATASFYAPLSGVPCDFDGDGDVDGVDLGRWRGGYGMTGNGDVGHGDADGDHDVDGADFLVWQRNVGVAPPAIGGVGAVPEPGAAALAAVALAACALRRATRAKSHEAAD